MCSTAGENRGDEARLERAAALVVAWPQLATASLRVLDALRVEPAWMDDTASVREVLRAVAASPAFTTSAVAPTGGARVRAYRPVVAMATRLAGWRIFWLVSLGHARRWTGRRWWGCRRM